MPVVLTSRARAHPLLPPPPRPRKDTADIAAVAASNGSGAASEGASGSTIFSGLRGDRLYSERTGGSVQTSALPRNCKGGQLSVTADGQMHTRVRVPPAISRASPPPGNLLGIET